MSIISPAQKNGSSVQFGGRFFTESQHEEDMASGIGPSPFNHQGFGSFTSVKRYGKRCSYISSQTLIYLPLAELIVQVGLATESRPLEWVIHPPATVTGRFAQSDNIVLLGAVPSCFRSLKLFNIFSRIFSSTGLGGESTPSIGCCTGGSAVNSSVTMSHSQSTPLPIAHQVIFYIPIIVVLFIKHWESL